MPEERTGRIRRLRQQRVRGSARSHGHRSLVERLLQEPLGEASASREVERAPPARRTEHEARGSRRGKQPARQARVERAATRYLAERLARGRVAILLEAQHAREKL